MLPLVKPLWVHQKRGIDEVLALIHAGYRRICLTSPTGGGKTRMIAELAADFLGRGQGVVLYTNRKLLLEQLSLEMSRFGLSHGVRAAGVERGYDLPFQVASIQTEHSRRLERPIHDAGLAVIDEAHCQVGEMARRIIDGHTQEGGAVVGVTATPLDLGGLYDQLVIAGTVSELRACGALVACKHVGCDEPDLRNIGKVPMGQDLSEKQNVKAIMVPGVHARVIDWFRKLNPEQKPTILFGPGKAESLWFAEQFAAAGTTAAHIDGEEVWVNGKLYRSSREARAEVLEMSADGRIRVLCNRFVLREGIDAPWLSHGIFATVFGSLQSYLQSGGRLLRSHPSLTAVTLQDHGGNWWRHGSLNADRAWNLGLTSHIVAGLREDKLRTKKLREPIRCPRCSVVNVWNGQACPCCGFQPIDPNKKSRPVVQADGSLREHEGDIFRPRRVSQRNDAAKRWQSMYYRAKKAGLTFRQAEAVSAKENNWSWPSRQLPLMPKAEIDFFQKVADVPPERLR